MQPAFVAARASEQDGVSEVRETLMDRKKLPLSRRVWRVTPDAPMGEFIDVDPGAVAPGAAAPDVVPRVLDPAPVVDWRSSSWDLLNGLEVNDEEESIPGDLFDELFKR